MQYFFKKVLTDKSTHGRIKTVKGKHTKRKEVNKMTNKEKAALLKELDKEYYKAVAVKDWKTAKELLDKTTKIQNELVFGYYEHLRSF